MKTGLSVSCPVPKPGGSTADHSLPLISSSYIPGGAKRPTFWKHCKVAQRIRMKLV
jgi:hypothetical protein